ncbi:MAG: SLC13 family permease [Erysipelotrichaceae bacterium]
MDQKTIALILFGLTYIALMSLPKHRARIALGMAILFIVIGILPYTMVFKAIDFNVLLMIGGTMGIVSLFIESRMPSLMADYILDKTPNVKYAIVALALFAGLISAFVDNVATVLMVAPVALNIAKKLKINPVMSIIAIAVSSNLQGAATLVGDTTAILLGSYAKMNFLDFFFWDGKIGMFWVVQAGAVISGLVLLYLFRNQKQAIHLTEKETVDDYFPSYLLGAMIILLILASFIPNKWEITNGLICVSLMAIGLIRVFIRHKHLSKVATHLLEIDFQTLLLLASLFVLIAGINNVGLVNDIGKLFLKVSGDNLFIIYTLLVWVSVFLSAFIDNIPYIATMLPIVAVISTNMGINPAILYLGLLSGATLGGNLTPIGASANIAAIGILRKEGYTVTTKDFMRIGVPFTMAAVITGYILIWLIYAL